MRLKIEATFKKLARQVGLSEAQAEHDWDTEGELFKRFFLALITDYLTPDVWAKVGELISPNDLEELLGKAISEVYNYHVEQEERVNEAA